MSAHQMVCHLADSFRFLLGRMTVSDVVTPLSRTVVKWWALYVPLPWPPGMIRTRPEIDQVLGGGTKPVDFAGDLAELGALLEEVTAPAVNLEHRPHPLFGRMSNADWLRWGYVHMDHHLRQLRRRCPYRPDPGGR
jgi:DinB family protein